MANASLTQLHDDGPTERLSLVVGLLLAAGTLVAIGLLALARPDWSRNMLAQMAFHVFPGRETGIPAGLFLGTPVWLVGALAAMQDVVTLLVGYPLVLWVARSTLRIRKVEAIVHKPHPKREHFAQRTETVGVTLIALSLWIPFLPSGAFIAALLARAAGYRPRVFLPIIAVSALLAAVAYTFLVDQVARQIGHGPTVVLALGLVVVIGSALVLRRWLKRKDAAPPG